MKINSKLGWIRTGTLLVLFVLASLNSTGCTVHTTGMTLPNPHYRYDIPEYHPRGAEFPFPNEAANLQEAGRELQRSP